MKGTQLKRVAYVETPLHQLWYNVEEWERLITKHSTTESDNTN